MVISNIERRHSLILSAASLILQMRGMKVLPVLGIAFRLNYRNCLILLLPSLLGAVSSLSNRSLRYKLELLTFFTFGSKMYLVNYPTQAMRPLYLESFELFQG